MLTDPEIQSLAIAVRTSVVTRWHHPDWNYMYYDQFDAAVERGIRLALQKAEAKDSAERGALRSALKKCFAHLGEEIERKSLNDSARDGTQNLSAEVAKILDAAETVKM